MNDALQKKGMTVAFRAEIYDADGGIDSSYAYLDPDRVVYVCDSYIEVNEKGDIYGFDNDKNTVYRYLFLDDSIKDHVVEVTGYISNPDEIVLSVTKKDGNIIVRAQDAGEENLANMADLMNWYGYDVDESFKIINEYILDSKTYEISCYNVYANISDKDFLFIKNIRINNSETYVIDSGVIDAVKTEDCRVVTVVADAGTEQKTVYRQTIAKGGIIKISLSLKHSMLYTDEACTMVYDGGADLYEDLTLYTTRN